MPQAQWGIFPWGKSENVPFSAAGAIYVFLLIFPLENCEKKQNVISAVAHGDDFCYNPECKVGLCFWFGVKEAILLKRNVCLLCILTVLLAGCTPSVREVPFVFRKPADQIVSVELLEVAPGPVQKAPCRVVAELDPEYYGLLIETAENTPCYTNYLFHNRDKSCCIRIRYADGETEVWIGSSVCVLTPEGEQNFLDIGFGESAVDNMVKMFLEMGEVAAQ